MFGGLLHQVKQAGINELWKQYGPQVENLIAAQLVNYAEEKINNDDELRRLLNLVYDHLPSHITAVLARDLVVNKIVENKALILAQVHKLRAQNA